MKDTLISILENDKSYNKSATRYLYKTCPELWKEILTKTSFLSSDAVPKQRVWHILNDIWMVPTCPVTGLQLKWFENRYLTTSSRSAKMLYQHNRGDFSNGHNTESNRKRKESNIIRVGLGRKYRSKETYTKEQLENSRKTFLAKYGVDNPSKSLEVRRKISDAHILRGATPRDQRSLRQMYYDAVWYYTEQSWKNYFDKINPDRKNRSVNSLDHIYSIQQGFRDHIPPYIIGHWSNLRIISVSDNSKKGMRCDKTKEELFDDIFG